VGSYDHNKKYSIDLGNFLVDLSPEGFNCLFSAHVGFVQVANVDGVGHDEEGKEDSDYCFHGWK
jgi:hypothetical protein